MQMVDLHSLEHQGATGQDLQNSDALLCHKACSLTYPWRLQPDILMSAGAGYQSPGVSQHRQLQHGPVSDLSGLNLYTPGKAFTQHGSLMCCIQHFKRVEDVPKDLIACGCRAFNNVWA